MSAVSFIMKKISRLVVKHSHNDYNRLFSWYFNLRYLPWHQAKCLPIVFYGHPRIVAQEHTKIEIQAAEITHGMIQINKTNESPCNFGCDIELVLKGKSITFQGGATIGSGGKWVFYGDSEVVFGANILINNGVMIGSCASIKIGDNVVIAHQCQIFDTDFHFVYNINSKVVKNQCSPIIIGKNVWLGNRVSICKGAHLPDYSIVAANSMVNKDFSHCPTATFFAGIPAIPTKKRGTLIRRNDNMLWRYFVEHNCAEYEVQNAYEQFGIDLE